MSGEKYIGLDVDQATISVAVMDSQSKIIMESMRALMRLQDQMRRMRHSSIREQIDCLNQMLRGHYAYYGIARNIRALQRVHRAVECYWRKMLSSRSWQGQVWWKQFQQIKERFPLLRPKLYLVRGVVEVIAGATGLSSCPPQNTRPNETSGFFCVVG